MILFYVVHIIVLVAYALCASKDELPSAADVSMIFVGFKHGSRNPFAFFKNDNTRDKYDWGWEGEGQTTNRGKQQAYGLGKFLRQRYANLLPKDPLPKQVKCTSPKVGCYITMTYVLAGLFPPVGHAKWNEELQWQAVPIENNDPMLRMTKVNCPPAAKLFQSATNDSKTVQAMLKDKHDLIEYVAKNAGFNDTLDDMNNAADNVQSLLDNKVPTMPDWIEKPTLKGYENKKSKMIEDILSFAEVRELQCANDKDCQKAQAGLWINEIVDLLNQKKSGALKERKGHFYACHTETLLSLMKMIKMNISQTPMTSGFILEFRENPPSIRYLYHESDEADFKVHKARIVPLAFGDNPDWAPLDTFVKNVQSSSFSDWQKFCGVPKCD